MLPQLHTQQYSFNLSGMSFIPTKIEEKPASSLTEMEYTVFWEPKTTDFGPTEPFISIIHKAGFTLTN